MGQFHFQLKPDYFADGSSPYQAVGSGKGVAQELGMGTWGYRAKGIQFIEWPMNYGLALFQRNWRSIICVVIGVASTLRTWRRLHGELTTCEGLDSAHATPESLTVRLDIPTRLQMGTSTRQASGAVGLVTPQPIDDKQFGMVPLWDLSRKSVRIVLWDMRTMRRTPYGTPRVIDDVANAIVNRSTFGITRE